MHLYYIKRRSGVEHAISGKLRLTIQMGPILKVLIDSVNFEAQSMQKS